MKIIAECSFDLQGKTYEYELNDDAVIHSPDHEDEDTVEFRSYTNLYALTCKTEPFPDLPSPKEFSIVRVQRIKPYSEKEFEGELKKIHHLFFR